MEARWHSSSAIIGLMPVRCPYKAFCTEVGEVEIQFLKTSSVTSRGFSFAMVWGIKYSRPGRTSLTELMLAETCLMLSMIVPSSLQKIMLLCFPMISTIRRFLHRSPNSSKCSSSNSKIRSSPGCFTEIMRALPICFLKSIQKFGAVRGLVLLFAVR